MKTMLFTYSESKSYLKLNNIYLSVCVVTLVTKSNSNLLGFFIVILIIVVTLNLLCDSVIF